MHRYRSHTCGALRESHVGETVRLSGWCHRIRDHGGVLFIDLRDHYGLTQVVADPDSAAFKIAEKLRSEWVVRIDGAVRQRPEGTTNAEEGCLSVPEFYDFIDRAAVIRVRAFDPDGKPFELDAEGMLAVCIQHEMDHLEGKLFVDYLSELKRERLKKKAVKKAKRAATDTADARTQKSVPVI